MEPEAAPQESAVRRSYGHGGDCTWDGRLFHRLRSQQPVGIHLGHQFRALGDGINDFRAAMAVIVCVE